MSRSHSDHQANLRALNDYLDVTEDPDSGMDDVRNAHHEFLTEFLDDADDELETIFCLVQAQLGQMHRDKYTCENYTLPQAIGEFCDLYKAYLDNNATLSVLRDWANDVQDIVREHTPKSTVMEDHNLEEEFDKAVTQIVDDLEEN